MAGWKLKAVIVTVVTLCALPVIFRRHSKCNLSSVITQLVRKALRASRRLVILFSTNFVIDLTKCFQLLILSDANTPHIGCVSCQ